MKKTGKNMNTSSYKTIGQNSGKTPIMRLVVIFCMFIFVISCGIVINRGYHSYYQTVEEGNYNSNRLTHTLSDHVRLTFLAGDLALKRAVDRQYFNTLFGNNLSEDIHHNFRIWTNETPQISAMMMTDKNGKIKVIYRKKGYKTWLGGKESVKGLEFFSQHQHSPDSDLLYVGWQNSWIPNHDGFVVMSRRISGLDGSFAGVIMVAINNDYIHNFFHSIEANKKTKLVLMRDDGKPLINQINDEEEIELLGKIMRDNKVANQPSGIHTYVSINDIDDNLRQFSFDRIPNLHMILSIVTYGDDIFANWHASRVSDLIFLSIFTLFIFIIYFLAAAGAKQMQRVQNSERAAVLASQAKSDFLANMSHELRTPLNAIIGFSEMIEAGYFGNVNVKQKERVHDIHFCGTHLLELINDILEFSKGEAGKIELHVDKVFLPKLIDESVRVFAERSRNEGINVISNVAKDLPMIMADRRKIKQILLNLISNAVKFTEKGGTVEASCAMDEDNNLVFSVTDTGSGIAEADIPKALSTFGQVHDNPAKGGTGLGLPLCKMFTELHGGSLTIKSIVGVGTKVCVTIPSDRVIWSSTNVSNLSLDGVLKSRSKGVKVSDKKG